MDQHMLTTVLRHASFTAQVHATHSTPNKEAPTADQLLEVDQVPPAGEEFEAQEVPSYDIWENFGTLTYLRHGKLPAHASKLQKDRI
jgi:hypothetical protein